jgi:simple sugar transport system permease protein
LVIIRNKKTLVLFIITIFVIGLMSILRPETFFSMRNFQSIGVQIPEFGLLAIAISLCLLTGGIDLSVVATANLTGIVTAWLLTNFITPEMSGTNILLMMILIIVMALILSTFLGFLNGILITRVGITPILATLGTMGLFGGLGVIITKGVGITGLPEKFLYLGTAIIGKVPIQLYIFAVVVLLIGLVVNRSLFGFNVFMIGANPIAARFSGININNVLVRVYMLSGFLAGISGLLIISKANSARSGYGASFLLPAVLVAVMGGIDARGGFGNITGVVLSLILLQSLQSGFNILGFSSFFKNIILGAMLLLVMVINYIGARTAEKLEHRRELQKVLNE